MRKKILLVVLIFVILASGLFLFFRNFKIHNVTCESQYGECNTQLKSVVLNVKDKNIQQTRDELNKILKNGKSIESFDIKFRLPNNFDIYIVEKKAIAAYVAKDGKFVLADSEGEIVGTVNETPLPKITSYIDLNPQQFKYIANLMSTIYTFYGNSDGKVTADGFEVDRIQGKDVIFPLEGDRDILLGSLSLILSRLPSVKEASTIRVIDLRFRNPVLR